MTVNGYGLCMNTVVKPVAIADVIVEHLNECYKIAQKKIYKNYNREGDYMNLVHDLFLRMKGRKDKADQKGFAETDAQAKAIIIGLIDKYAKSCVYVPCISDLAQAISQTEDKNLTICRLESIPEDILYDSNLEDEVNIDIYAAKQFAGQWDKMKNPDELSIPEKVAYIKSLAPTFMNCQSNDERAVMINAIRETLDLGPDTDPDVIEAITTLVKH